MKKVIMVVTVLILLAGCAMFGTWKAIPPPGGCDRCHTAQISSDWQVAYSPATLQSETGPPPWQQPDSLILSQPESRLDEQKITEERCFRCHKGPDRAHLEYGGRYHH